MDYSLLVGIHNCNAPDHQQQLDLGDTQTTDGCCAVTNSSDDSSDSAATPPSSPLTLRRNRTVSYSIELDSRLESFAIKSAECKLLISTHL